MSLLLSIVRWYRRVLPVPGLTLGAIVLFLCTEAGAMLFDFHFRRADQIFADHNPFGGSLCLMAAAVYAAFRVFYFHPLWRPQYRRWLNASPWTIREPLPEGPVMFSIQDLIPLALLTLGSLRIPRSEWYFVLLLFLGVWTLFSTITFAVVGPRWLAYGIVFAFGGVTRFLFPHPGIAVIFIGAIVIAVQVGHYLCIDRFHEWDLSWGDKFGFDAIISSDTESLLELQQKHMHGWPHDQMAPNLERHRLLLAPITGALLALLISWHVDGFLRMVSFHAWRPIPFSALAPLICMLGFAASILRAVIYVSGHAPPIGFFGRLATVRLIIPGYDYIFIPSITVMILSAGGSVVLQQLHTPPILSAAGLLFLVIFLITTMPPDLVAFHLTGNHRINPDMKQRTSQFLTKD